MVGKPFMDHLCHYHANFIHFSSKYLMRIIFFLTCLLLNNALIAAETPIQSKISAVTVYLEGAQITRSSFINLQKGVHVLLLQNLPADLDPQSIQVDGPVGLILQGVSHETDYLNKQRVSEQAQQLNAKAEGLQREIEQLQARLSVYEQEEKLLLANQNLGGKEQAISVAQLREAADLFRQRLQEIKLAQLDLQQQINAGQKQLTNIRKTQTETLSKEDKPSSKIIINLEANRAVSGILKISYLVKSAGWFPAYDVRVDKVGEPLLLQYKARVFQQTGEEWPDVSLTLSTGNPGSDNNQPVLDGIKINFNELVRRMPKSNGPVTQVSGQVRATMDQQPLPGVAVRVVGTVIGTVTDTEGRYTLNLPRNNQLLSFSFVGFQTLELPVTGPVLNASLEEDVEQLSEVVVTGYGVDKALRGKVAGVSVKDEEEGIKIRGMSSIAAPEVVQQQNAVTTEFTLERPYTVLSDGQQQTVEMAQHMISALYRYYSAPVISENAFLTASITGWEGYDLLEGEANLFFEGKFVGKTLLDPNLTGDTLNFSLGRDRNVVVERKLMKDFQEKKFFGSKRKETVGYEILVRNAKEQPIEVVIQDRYPISANEAINVKVEELSGASVTEDTGLLRWQLSLNSKENKTLQLRYTLEYPKDKKVTIY